MIVATCTSAGTEAALSVQLAARLSPHAIAFDINAACAGFCYALSAASSLVESGSVSTVLVVGADQMSKLLDPADLATAMLFGDGAGAVVVRSCPRAEAGIGPTAWSSAGEHAQMLRIPDGETTLRMRGPEVFRWAVDEVHKVATAAIARAGVAVSDIDVFVPHQANVRIIEAIRLKLGLGHAATGTDIEHAGNTSAASVPLALDRLRRSGLACGGQLALLAGYGAGLTIAAQVVRLP